MDSCNGAPCRVHLPIVKGSEHGSWQGPGRVPQRDTSLRLRKRHSDSRLSLGIPNRWFFWDHSVPARQRTARPGRSRRRPLGTQEVVTQALVDIELMVSASPAALATERVRGQRRQLARVPIKDCELTTIHRVLSKGPPHNAKEGWPIRLLWRRPMEV